MELTGPRKRGIGTWCPAFGNNPSSLLHARKNKIRSNHKGINHPAMKEMLHYRDVKCQRRGVGLK